VAGVWGQEAIRGHIHLVRNTPYGKKIENKLNRGAGRPGPAPGALPSWLARGGGSVVPLPQSCGSDPAVALSLPRAIFFNVVSTTVFSGQSLTIGCMRCRIFLFENPFYTPVPVLWRD